MNRQNLLGLQPQDTKKTAEKLNTLMASYAVFYQNVRGFHWYVEGHEFFELHEKFEELYTSLSAKIDEIAERTISLGEHPLHTYSAFLKHSKIKESDTKREGTQAVQSVLKSFKLILELERALLDFSDEVQDEGTNAMISDSIRANEETVWMYSAFLGN